MGNSQYQAAGRIPGSRQIHALQADQDRLRMALPAISHQGDAAGQGALKTCLSDLGALGRADGMLTTVKLLRSSKIARRLGSRDLTRQDLLANADAGARARIPGDNQVYLADGVP
jgi:hypothetical protein